MAGRQFCGREKGRAASAFHRAIRPRSLCEDVPLQYLPLNHLRINCPVWPTSGKWNLALFRKIHQSRRCDFQCVSQFDDVFESNIALPALNTTKIASSQTTMQRQLLLRPAFRLTQRGKSSAKEGFRVGRRHVPLS